LLLVVAVVGVDAHGVSPKGELLSKNVAVKGITGNCDCLWQWYTLKVNPGAVKIQVHIEKLGRVTGPTYGLVMYLFQGSHTLRMTELGCLPHKHCANVAGITYRVRKAAVYYVRLSAPGILSMNYRLLATGTVGKLHCARYC